MTPSTPHRAMERLGVLSDFLELTRTARSPDEAQAGMVQIRKTAERNWKRLARSAHPDHGGSTAAMQALNQARDLVRRLDVCPPQQPVVVIRVGFGGYGAATTAGSIW